MAETWPWPWGEYKEKAGWGRQSPDYLGPCRLHKEFGFYSKCTGKSLEWEPTEWFNNNPSIHKLFIIRHSTYGGISPPVMGQKLHKWTDFSWPWSQLLDHPLKNNATLLNALESSSLSFPRWKPRNKPRDGHSWSRFWKHIHWYSVNISGLMGRDLLFPLPTK